MAHDGSCGVWPETGDMNESFFCGGNYRFNELNAAMLRRQARRLDRILDRLQETRRFVTERLELPSGARLVRSHDESGNCGVCFLVRAESVALAEHIEAAIHPHIPSHRPINSGRHVYSAWDVISKKAGGHHPDWDCFRHPKNRHIATHYERPLKRTDATLSQTVLCQTPYRWSRTRRRKAVDAVNAALATLKGAAAGVALLLAVAAPAAVPTSGSAQTNLLYTTPAGIVFDVTAEGLTRVGMEGRTLAAGNWSAFNAEHWFSKGRTNGPVRAKEYQEKKLEIVSPTLARVRHVRDDIICLFEYAFDSEDVTITARVENNHPEAELCVTGFRGLTFTFDRPPEGLHHAMHPSYSQAHGIGICHPSHQNRIGGRYAIDDSLGVGISPWNGGLERTLILFDYGSWAANKRENDPVRRLIVLRPAAIPPRGARTFDIRLRVSPNRDWKHLLQPYREHFQRAFGPVRYRSDSRWIATDYLNHSQAAVSPTNPYGFHGGHRRIDTLEGATAFCDKVLPTLKNCDGQAIIVWGQGGDDPRREMYRADFDILPPEVEKQWKAIIAPRFKSAGVGLGVTTRPRHLAVRKDWVHDRTIDINPDDPGHRSMLWQRFERMIERGCTHFYLDSFGASFEDVKLMRWLREKLGPDILTYAEHQCDAIVPFTGGYSETTLHADKPGEAPHYRLWSGVRNWEIYRFLCPGARIATRLYQVKGTPPDDTESVDRWCARHNIIPLLPFNGFKQRAAGIKAIQDEAKR